MRDSLSGAGCVVGPVGLDEGELGDLGHEAPPAEADDGELDPGDELVAEGAGDAKERTCFGDGVDEAVLDASCRRLKTECPWRSSRSRRKLLPYLCMRQRATRNSTTSWSKPCANRQSKKERERVRVNKESEPSDRMSSEVSANFQADRQMSVVSSLLLQAARPLGRRLCRRLGGRSLDIVSLETQ